ncbi:MAG: CocE/NonD family hydrolase, partial [Phycisphaeraceae bacterium]|nr:CocE/NonD family hydrolase [Phycisphaeraceae bacterium]
PYDQRSIEQRADVLAYTTDTLERDTEITGPIVLKLYVSSSAPDTDFTAKLTDVYPDGRSINIAEGMLRTRYRDERWSDPRPMTPGEVVALTIDMQVAGNVFKRGHRIRLLVTSSSFPLWDRNLNTGEDAATGIRMNVAEQTIYHDPRRPSHVMLPVIPRTAAGVVE